MKTTKSIFAFSVFIIFGCILLIACGGGGGGDGDGVDDDNKTEENYGNEDYKIEDSEAADPLNGYRINEVGASTTLPKSIDYSDQMPEVRDQGGTSACTSWATGYYGKTFQEAQEMGWDPNENAFSPSFLYAVQCRAFEQPRDLNRAIEVLQKIGIAKWDTMPFEDLGNADKQIETNNYKNLAIPDAAVQEAKIYRCGSALTLKTLGELKQALTQGAVPLGLWYWGSPGNNVSPEENYIRRRSRVQKNQNGHAVLCVGYDDDKFGEGALKFINSWGADFGEDGFSWIKYADFNDLVFAKVPYKDLTNPDNNTDPSNSTQRPEPPEDVSATDGAGNYVDITWSRVAGAQYYRILRTDTEFTTPYEEIGVSYEGKYRDYPSPGVTYYYAVVGVNDLGESNHYPNSTDADGHVDIGSSQGEVLQTPTLDWSTNDEEGSHFIVTDIDPAATAMEVFISTASEGPWKSLGWAQPGDFTLNLGDNSEYGNKAPFVRIRVANTEASSDLSNTAQVGENINSDVQVGQITDQVITPQESSILLRWVTDGSGHFDFFEIWRYCLTNTDQGSEETNEWVKVGYTNLSDTDAEGYNIYEDTTPIPGASYYYVIAPVYQGTYGQLSYSNTPYKIENSGTNLHLTSFQYHYEQISSPTEFPRTVVRNDGATRVDSFTLTVLAYDWANRTPIVMGTFTVDTPIEPGDQRAYRITYNIDDSFANGQRYFWGMMIDYENAIQETYEDDNLLWSKEAWWLSQNVGSADIRGTDLQSQSQRLGSSKPFSHKRKIIRQSEEAARNAQPVGEGIYLLDEGPMIFHRPDFCNDHSK